MKKNVEFYIFSVFFVVSFFIGMYVGNVETTKYIRKEAVRNNVAKYIVDENGNVEFVWLNLLPS